MMGVPAVLAVAHQALLKGDAQKEPQACCLTFDVAAGL